MGFQAVGQVTVNQPDGRAFAKRSECFLPELRNVVNALVDILIIQVEEVMPYASRSQSVAGGRENRLPPHGPDTRRQPSHLDYR